MVHNFLFLTAAVLPTTQPAARPAVAPPPREVVFPVPLRIAFSNRFLEVTAVDAESITVRTLFYSTEGCKFERQLNEADTERLYTGFPLVVGFATRTVACTQLHAARRRLTLTLQDGGEEVVRLDDQPAIRVRYDPDAPHRGWGPAGKGFSYRPEDVRVGDFVSLWLTTVGGEDVCKWVCIDRRPGGQVPRAPGEDEDEVLPWHEHANERQAFEDFGIPLPTEEASRARYKQRYRAREARLAKEAERLAPPPREAKLKPPAP